MTGIHSGHRERMRLRFRNSGFDSFSEHEILELLLMYAIPQKDVNPLAHSLIDEFGSLSNVFKADYEHLLSVKGIGENAATMFVVFSQLRHYLDLQEASADLEFKSITNLRLFLTAYYKTHTNESSAVLLLTPSLKLIKFVRVGEGNMTSTPVNIRKIAEEALKHKACYVILVHNHPSGNCKPSKTDDELMPRLLQALSAVEVCFLDHIIVSNSSFFSYHMQTNFFVKDEEQRRKQMLADSYLAVLSK